MSEVKHDYKAALQDLEEQPYGRDTAPDLLGLTLSDNWDAIIHALKLAVVVTGEPDHNILQDVNAEWEKESGYCIGWGILGVLFKRVRSAMIAQAEKEIG